MLHFLTANISPDGLCYHNAEKSHLFKPYGIVDQLIYYKCFIVMRNFLQTALWGHSHNYALHTR
ncbi:MAG: hypothetical protein C1941_05500 [Prosthecochloris sp.]|nr:hypothetical protein [Prosthecochloris sp.]